MTIKISRGEELALQRSGWQAADTLVSPRSGQGDNVLWPTGAVDCESNDFERPFSRPLKRPIPEGSATRALAPSPCLVTRRSN